jgi:hypothetical protein
MLSLMNLISFPARVTRFEWSEGNNALEVDLEFYGNMEKHILAVTDNGEKRRAAIRFGKTSGTIHSIRLGTVLNQIVIRYHDFGGKYFDHNIILDNSAIPKQSAEWADELELRRLSEYEINEIKEWLRRRNNQNAKFGNKIRNMIIDAIIRSGEIAGSKIDPNKILTEARIISRDDNDNVKVLGRPDIVFVLENGKLAVAEVKATEDSRNFWEQYERAWKQLKGDQEKGKVGYIQLIKEYCLKVMGEIRKDIEAYILIVVKVDLETGLSNMKMEVVSKD